MAKVRQLPELYLRGSLANITMAGLTHDQRQHADTIVDYVTHHPDMQKHKNKVMKKFGVTIGADYADDRENAEQEFRVAVWRGVINLFYHRKYSFQCRACGQSHYMTKRSKPKPLDRIQAPCPNCQKVEVVSPGDVPELTAGQFLTLEEFQASYKDMPDGWKAPTYRATIDPIPGELRYSNPNDIINDDRQLQKFFGEFVWNYFRQQINENKRKEHRKEQEIVGPADYIILQDIISLCLRMEVDYNFCEKTEPRDGKYNIRIFGLFTPPEFTAELGMIRARADLYGITITTDHSGIAIHLKSDAPHIGTKVMRPEHVSVLDNFSCVAEDQDSCDYTVSQISYRTVGMERMDQEDHVQMHDNSESMRAVRGALPDGHCRDIFDILCQQGEKYLAFSEVYGDGEAKINHIAAFLGITTRAVNNFKQTIEVHCLANDLTPANT